MGQIHLIHWNLISNSLTIFKKFNQMHLLQPRPSPYVYYMLPENQAITLEAFPATSTAMSVPLAPPPRIKTRRSSNCSGFLF